VLAAVGDFSGACLTLVVDTSLSGLRVGRELDRIAELARLSREGRQRQRDRADIACHAALAGGPGGIVATIVPGKPQESFNSRFRG
jgi:putative transposase